MSGPGALEMLGLVGAVTGLAFIVTGVVALAVKLGMQWHALSKLK